MSRPTCSSFVAVLTLAVLTAPLSGCFAALLEGEEDERRSELPPRRTEPVLRVANDRTCVVERSGRLRCAGSDRHGKLGGRCKDTCEDVDGEYPCCVTPTELPDIGDVADLALGDDHTCALGRDGSVRCWGSNEHGQLGAAPSPGGAAPNVVSFLSDVRQVVAGQSHTCALNGDGSVRCWGRNEAGQLGDGSMFDHFLPRIVPRLRGVRQLAASWRVSCALLDDGKAWCWGSNELRDIGPWWRCVDPLRSGGPSACRSPREVPHVAGITHITASGCAIASSELVCWDAGVLLHRTATVVSDFGRVVLFDRAWNHSCAMDDRGAVRCLRRTLEDEVGTPRPPETVAGAENARQLAVAADHACALVDDARVRCWGANTSGQLGSGTTDEHPAMSVVSW